MSKAPFTFVSRLDGHPAVAVLRCGGCNKKFHHTYHRPMTIQEMRARMIFAKVRLSCPNINCPSHKKSAK